MYPAEEIFLWLESLSPILILEDDVPSYLKLLVMLVFKLAKLSLLSCIFNCDK
jgi:hypothetical protein